MILRFFPSFLLSFYTCVSCLTCPPPSITYPSFFPSSLLSFAGPLISPPFLPSPLSPKQLLFLLPFLPFHLFPPSSLLPRQPRRALKTTMSQDQQVSESGLRECYFTSMMQQKFCQTITGLLKLPMDTLTQILPKP